MNRKIFSSLVLLFFASTFAASLAKQEPQPLRQLYFPDQSVGSLFTLKSGEQLTDRQIHLQFVADAKGKLQIRSNMPIILKANYRVVDNPALFDQIKDGSLDGIHIDDIDAGDESLKHISHLKTLKRLQLHQTEVTDIGVSYLKNLTNLEALSITRSGIRGSTLFDIPLTKLVMLELSGHELDPKAFFKVGRYTSIKDIELTRTLLTDGMLQGIGKLSNLEHADLASNQLLTDSGIKYLTGLKHLNYLDLRKSQVTLKGINQLSGLPLKHLFLPREYSPAQYRELQNTFKSCALVEVKSTDPKSQLDVFSQLH